MSYILISIFAYALNAGATVIDKILLTKSVPTPLVYVFYINILGLLTMFLIPFGVMFNFNALVFSVVSGIGFIFALYFFFTALKIGEASVVAPVVGSLNPLFSILLGSIFLSQHFESKQYLAFAVIILGTGILTFNQWFSKIKFNQQLFSMIMSGFSFAISYLFLREAFLQSNFITGLTISRLATAMIVSTFLFFPAIRSQIFGSKISHNGFANKTSILLAAGQIMGGLAGFILAYAVSLANPALVNSLFGAQYLVILIVAIILGRNHPHLLDESLSRKAVMEKIIGAATLSLGVYLLAV